MITENMKRIALIVAAVFCMVAAIGCCNTQASRGTPTAYASKYRQSRNTAGDIVYNIGSGTTANSNAVRLTAQQNPAPCAPSRNWVNLCGEERKSEPSRKWWSCPPPPPVEQRAEPGRRWWNCPPPPPMRPAARPEAAPAAPIVSTVAPAAGGCATGNCDWASLGMGNACEPGEGLGACYTLTDEERLSGPTVYVPNAGSLEALSGLDRVDLDPVGGDVQTASAQADVEAALGIEKTVETPVPAVVDAVVETATPEPSIPEVVETVETVDTAALRPPEMVDIPSRPMEMPPVFRKGATEAAAEEVLSRIGKVESIDALSPVELPPEL